MSTDLLLTFPPRSLALGWSDAHAFPMASVCLASFCKSRGVCVRVYHGRPYRLKEVLSAVKTGQPAVLGMTCDSSNFQSCFTISRAVKKINKDILVVLGGIHATYFHELILRHVETVDVVVRGEGEGTLLDIVEAVRRGRKTFAGIRGLSYRSGQAVTVNGERDVIEDLDDLPLNDYGFVDMKKIAPDVCPDWWPLHAARGCPFNCRYCASAGIWKRKYRAKSAGRLVEDMEALKELYQVGGTWFNDNLFTARADRTKELCSLLSERGSGMTWGCYARIDCVDPPMLELMAKAGCVVVNYGVDSFSGRMLRLMNKNYTPRQAVEILNFTHDLGVDTRFEMVLGFPGETQKTVEETIEQFDKLYQGVTNTNVNLFELHPGSWIYETVKKRGFVTDEMWFRGFTMYDFIHLFYPKSFVGFLENKAEEIRQRYAEENKKRCFYTYT